MTDTQRVGNSKESKTSAEKHDNSTRYRTNALRVIVTSLFIDILAFTVILPLLPRLLDHYDTHGDRVFHSVKQVIQQYRSYLGLSILKGSRLDIVLVGGLVGSLFSLLQFVAAPVLGSLSDTFGRRRVLLLSMVLTINSDWKCYFNALVDVCSVVPCVSAFASCWRAD